MTEATASIHGLFLPDEVAARLPIQLSPDLAMLALDQQTRELMAATGTLRLVGALNWGDAPYALRTVYETALNEDGMAEAANELLDTAVQGLRVHQPGRVYVGGILHWSASATAHRFYQRPWPANPFAVYSFESVAHVMDFAAFWRSFRTAIGKNPALALACRWFSRAAEVAELEDRITLLMTAAEALFGTTHKDRSKGAVIAERAKKLDPSTSEEDVATLAAAYRSRNAAIHDGSVAEWKRTDQVMTPAQLTSFVDETAAILRRLLRTATLDNAPSHAVPGVSR